MTTPTRLLTELPAEPSVESGDLLHIKDVLTGYDAHIPVDTFLASDIHALIGSRHTASGLTVGQGLRATAADGYDFGALDLANVDATTGDLPFSRLTQIAGLSVLGVTGASPADVAAITAASDFQVLRRSGSAVAFGSVNLASANAVTGLLPFANIADGSALSVFGRSANSSGVQASITAGADGDVLRRSGTSIGFGAMVVGAITPGTARQLLQTNAGATGSEWTSNIDLAGTLDVTGAAVFDARASFLGKVGVNFLGNPGEELEVVGSIGTYGTTGGSDRIVLKHVSATPRTWEWYPAGVGPETLDLYERVGDRRIVSFDGSTGYTTILGTTTTLSSATAVLTFSSATGPHTISTGGTTDIALSPGSKKILYVSTGVLDWGAGNYTLTHSTGLLTASGALTLGGAITTSAPTTGTAKPWKLGNIITGQVGLILLATQYVELEVNGALYRLATV